MQRLAGLVLTPILVAALSCHRGPSPDSASKPPPVPPHSEAVEKNVELPSVSVAKVTAEVPAPDVAAGEAEPESPTTGEPLFVGGDVIAPQALHRVPVDLAACEDRWPPLIVVKSVIGKDGRLGSVEFLKQAPGPCAERRIREALEQWRFRPARLHGEPVAVYYAITMQVHFQ